MSKNCCKGKEKFMKTWKSTRRSYKHHEEKHMSVHSWVWSIEAVRTFSGLVDKKIEDIANLYKRDNKTLLFYAINKLKGASCYWYDNVPKSITSWGELKEKLCASFQVQLNRQIYIYVCQDEQRLMIPTKVAKIGNMDAKSVIKYIISGLDDRDLIRSLAFCDTENIPELLAHIKKLWKAC